MGVGNAGIAEGGRVGQGLIADRFGEPVGESTVGATLFTTSSNVVLSMPPSSSVAVMVTSIAGVLGPSS